MESKEGSRGGTDKDDAEKGNAWRGPDLYMYVYVCMYEGVLFQC